MCARYVFFSGKVIPDVFGVPAVPDLKPRYNIGPRSVVAVVVAADSGREVRPLLWGFVPHWSRDPFGRAPLVNARAETLLEKPTFRDAARRRRCLLPADGFYEWSGESGAKQPWLITVEPAPFGLAGVWEEWEGPDGLLQTCAVVTTAANEAVSEVHDRMPVIVDRPDFDAWLDPKAPLPERLLAPFPAARTHLHRVSPAVNNVRAEGPELVLPL